MVDVMPAIPRNYDSVRIAVNLFDLNTAADVVTTNSKTINDLMNGINDKLGQLALSWTGPAASDANQATTRWNNVMTALYGTRNDPSTGILNILASGVTAAVGNYAVNEQAIVKMFAQFFSALSNPPAASGTPPNSTQSVKDGTSSKPPYHDTSVNETF